MPDDERGRMMDAEEPPQVTSPCVQVCILDEGCGYCIGCGRTRAEIWRWTRASDGEKLEIIEAAAARIGGPQRPK